jgi:hypothetical protein
MFDALENATKALVACEIDITRHKSALTLHKIIYM